MNAINEENTLIKLHKLADQCDHAQKMVYLTEGGGTLKSFNRAMDARDVIWSRQFELARKIWDRRNIQPDLYDAACRGGFMDYGDDEFEA